MKMKRISIIALVLAVLMLFTACGPVGNVDTDTPSTATPKPTEPAPTASPIPTPEATPVPTPAPVASVSYGTVESKYVFAENSISLYTYPGEERVIRELPANSLLTVEYMGWVGTEEWYFVYARSLKAPSDLYGWICADDVVPYTYKLASQVDFPVVVRVGSEFWDCGNVEDIPTTMESSLDFELTGGVVEREGEYVKVESTGGMDYWFRAEDVLPDIEQELPDIIVGSRRYEEYTDHLIPADDYGPLVAYIGGREPEKQGLMTLDGEIVTDPVYSMVFRTGGEENFGSGESVKHDLLILRKGVDEVESLALAALDGSWVIETDAKRWTDDVNELRFFSETAMTIYSADGKEQGVYPYADMELSEEFHEIFMEHIDWGAGMTGQRRGKYIVLFQYGDDVVAVNMESGETGVVPYEEYMSEAAPEDLPGLRTEVTGDSTVYTVGEESFTLPHVSEAGGYDIFILSDCAAFADGAVYMKDGTELYPAEDGCVLTGHRDRLDGNGGVIVRTVLGGKNASAKCIRADGTELELPAGWTGGKLSVVGGLIEIEELESVRYYDMETGELVFALGIK